MDCTFRTADAGQLDAQIRKCRDEFERMVERMTKPQSSQTLDQAERDVFAQVMQLGRGLLDLRVQAEGDGYVGPVVQGPDNAQRVLLDYRSVQYRSVFGPIGIRRAHYWNAGREGFCPLDAKLNLPAHKDSYLLMEWALRMGVVQSYDETREGLAQLLGLELPKRQLQQFAHRAGAAVQEFYESEAAPIGEAQGSVLVVSADGKGVPMKKAEPAQAPTRLSKGQKRQKKRMALVGAIYRTDPRRPQEKSEGIYDKEVFARLRERDGFGLQLKRRARRHQRQVRRKVFIADGQVSLWDLRRRHFPGYVEVLDWMHATEYLWKTAYLWLPESSPQAHAWVKRQQDRFARGEVKAVIREIRRRIRNGTIQGNAKVQSAGKIIGYFNRNRHRMRYDRYLRWGIPIGSGVVEATCKHLVKQRMEGSGMRWVVAGAQAILDLRGTYLSDHWGSFWTFHKANEARRLYGRCTSASPGSERAIAA